jgi:4-hydroxy-3-methylbut-2-en-1-yl diphosphate synthase IspG/GcpE
MHKLLMLPECKKHEQALGIGMTWGQLAEKLLQSKNVRDVKALVRQAKEAGLI